MHAAADWSPVPTYFRHPALVWEPTINGSDPFYALKTWNTNIIAATNVSLQMMHRTHAKVLSLENTTHSSPGR